jgi:hypothetical protein
MCVDYETQQSEIKEVATMATLVINTIVIQCSSRVCDTEGAVL